MSKLTFDMYIKRDFLHALSVPDGADVHSFMLKLHRVYSENAAIMGRGAVKR